MTEAMLLKKSRLIGAKVKYYRNLCRMHQTELADKLGISFQYLSRIETGKQTPSLPLLMDIAEQLEVSLAKLVRDVR